MPETPFTTSKPIETRGGGAVVVACSANDLQPALREFLEQHLKLPEGTYYLLAVPGGPQFMALSEHLPKFAWAGQKWVGFFVEKLKVGRIVLVSHEDCAWYADERFLPAILRALGHGDLSMKDRQRNDLKHAAAALRSALPAAVVEAYFAEKTADGHLTFNREV